MTEEKDYTFCLSPGNKTRYAAGPFDINTRKPRYEIEINIPSHVRNQVEVKQFLMGSENNYQWVWNIENKSTWPAFIIIKKDGQMIPFI